ncbi:hypothetical protein FQN57_003944 [Myotisia sp. PD_48]|nr:hypothetical protein FQN57_003944 [Myotisia sp. PD_48]
MSNRREQCQEALGELTTHANRTMVAAGRWFRRPHQSNLDLKHTIPPAHEHFQRALDRLQEEIYLAKAILESDLESLQEQNAANKPKRTAAATTGQQKNGQSTAGTADNTPIVKKEPSTPSPLVSPSPLSSIQPPIAPPTAAPSNDQNIMTGMAPASSYTPLDHASTAPILHAAQEPAISQQTPSEPIPTGTVMDLTGDDEVTVPHSLPMANSKSGIDNPPGAISSLLPGLETYANAATDVNILDMLPPGTIPSAEASKLAQAGSSMANLSQNTHTNPSILPTTMMDEGRIDESMDDVPLMESNFDNLFVGAGDFGDDADDLMNNGEIGDLDDSWLP